MAGIIVPYTMLMFDSFLFSLVVPPTSDTGAFSVMINFPQYNLFTIVFFATIGSLCGSIVNYYLGTILRSVPISKKFEQSDTKEEAGNNNIDPTAILHGLDNLHKKDKNNRTISERIRELLKGEWGDTIILSTVTTPVLGTVLSLLLGLYGIKLTKSLLSMLFIAHFLFYIISLGYHVWH